MPDTSTSHFWLGQVTDPAAFESLFEEEYDDDGDTESSPFAAAQGEEFLDLDFVEKDYHDVPEPLEQMVADYSYASEWSPELIRRAKEKGLKGCNALVMVGADEVEEPRSCEGEGYRLHYLGTIDYPV